MRMHFQSLLAQPLLYGSLILLAASVGLRPQRRGRTALRVGAGIGIAFALFFMSDVAEALGLSGTLPPPMAAWTPAAAALLLGTAALLHLEDG
jgi:lipopolysaccharide export system permease protein